MSVRTNSSTESGHGEPEKATGRVDWTMLAVLAVVAGTVLFYKLGECRTLGSHEVYAAVPAREMIHTGNWTVPTFGGLPRLEKPPLSYWVLAVSAKLFGQFNEWTVRLPAATSALLLAVLIGYWAFRWYGPAAGLSAALVQITSVYVIIFARKAEVDMLLCLLTTSALFLIAQQPADEQGRRSFLRWTVVYCLLSLAWLAKFHYGPAMVLAPCVVYFVIQRRYRSLRHMLNPLGLSLFAASVVIWPYLVWQQVPEALAVWRGETVGRAVGELGHEPFWYYVPHMLWLSLPWTPYAVAVMPGSWRRAWTAGETRERFLGLKLWTKGDARERFLWVWFLTVIAIVTLSASKHKHYLIAALPMMSLLAGQRLAELIERARGGQAILTRRWGVILTVVCIASAVGASLAVTQKWPALREPSQVVSGILGVGGCLIVWLLVFRRATTAAYVAILVFLGCYVGVNGWILPGRDHRLPTAEFARAMRQEVAGQQPVGVYRMGMNEVVYYLDDPVFRMESLVSVAEQIESRGRLILVTYEPYLKELKLLGEGKILHRATPSERSIARKRPRLVLAELTARSTPFTGPGSGRSPDQPAVAKLPGTGMYDEQTLMRLDDELRRLGPQERNRWLDELLRLDPAAVRRMVSANAPPRQAEHTRVR